MENCHLEPPCEDFVNCFVCGKKIDIDDSVNITDDVFFCEHCFDFSVRYNISMIRKHLTHKDSDLIHNMCYYLDIIQEENLYKKVKK